MVRMLLTFLLAALPVMSGAQGTSAITWGPLVNVSQASGQWSFYPRIAVAGDTVHVLWKDLRRGSALYRRSVDGGSAWGQTVELGAASNPAEIVTAGDRVMAFLVVPQGGGQIVRSCCSSQGQPFQFQCEDITKLPENVSDVAAAREGNRVVAVWPVVSGSTVVVWMSLRPDPAGTEQWSAPASIDTFDTDPGQGAHVRVAIGDSTIVVGHIESFTGTISTRRSSDWGLSWSPDSRVYASPGNSQHSPQMAAFGSSVVMRWQHFFGSSQYYSSSSFAASSDDGARTWSFQTDLSAGLGGDNGYGDICIWGKRAVAIWANNPGPGQAFRLTYRLSSDGGHNWSPAVAVHTGWEFEMPRCETARRAVYVVGHRWGAGGDVWLMRGRVSGLPPVANAGPDMTIECTSPLGAVVPLDGSGSTDPDADRLTYTWSENGVPIAGPTEVPVVPVTLSLGTHVLGLTVTDGQDGAATDETVVDVVDTKAPTITVSLTPVELWPPNHKLVDVRATVVADDCCDPTPSVSLVSIASNEPDNGQGDGDEPADIQQASFGSPDYAFQLRAERSGKGQGRVYTVTYAATDASGEVATATATVRVPHSKGKGQAKSLAAEVVPGADVLHANAPNPFNPVTEIRFDVAAQSMVRLTVYNLAGQEVATLVERVMQAGSHRVQWDATGYASGIYLYRLQTDGFTGVRGMVLAR